MNGPSCGRMMFITLLVCSMGHLTALPSAFAQEEIPRAARQLFKEAAELQNKNDFELAADVWESFVERYPDLEVTHKAQHYLGVCRLQNGEIEKALDAFAAVVTKADGDTGFPLLEDALLNLGWCHFNMAQNGDQPEDRYPKSAEAFGQLISLYPEGQYLDQALYFRGESQYLQNKAQPAIADYRRLVNDFAESPFRENGMYALGVAYEDVDQADQAESTYRAFLDSYPNSSLGTEVLMRVAELVLKEAVAAEEAGDADAARDAYTRAEQSFAETARIESYSQRDHATFQQAFCIYKLGRVLDAANLYAKLVNDFPDSSYVKSSSISAGRSFYRAEKYEEAKQWLDRVRQNDRVNEAEATHWLCRINLRENKPEVAYLLANGALSKDNLNEFEVALKIDRADAAFAIPDRKESAYAMYVDVVQSHPGHPQAAQALYYAAYAAFENRQLDMAVKHCRDFVDQYADNALLPDVLYVQGESLIQLGQPAEAETAYRNLLAAGGDRPEKESWQLRLALAMYLQDKSSEALQFLTPLLGQFGNADRQAEAYHLAGACQFKDADYAGAKQSFNAALQAKRDWRQAEETYLLLARSQFRSDEVDAAIATCNQLMSEFPNSDRLVEAHYRLGEFKYSKDDFTEALGHYQRVIDSGDATLMPFALDGHAWTSLKLDDYNSAIASFTRLLAEFEQHSLVKNGTYGRSICFNQLDKHSEALQDITKYLSLDLNDDEKANGMFEQGIAQFGLEEYAAAAQVFSSLLEDFPDFGRREQALYELAWCYMEVDDSTKALAAFQKITEDYPETVNAAESHFHLAEVLYRNKDYNAAIGHYESAISKTDEARVAEKASYKLGWSHFHQSEFGEAASAFEDQLEEYPEGQYALDGAFMVAECYYRQNDFEKATAQYKSVWPLLENNDNAPDAHRASTLLHGAQSAGAIKEWDTALKFAQQFATEYEDAAEVSEAWLQVGRAQRGMGINDEALESFETASLLSDGAVGAQARCMIGEIHMAKKDFAEAQIHFRRVMSGYGGDEAPADVQEWQAFACFEAARCSHVRIADASGQQRTDLIMDATRYYRDVLEKYGDSPYAAQSRRQLESLANIN